MLQALVQVYFVDFPYHCAPQMYPVCDFLPVRTSMSAQGVETLHWPVIRDAVGDLQVKFMI